MEIVRQFVLVDLEEALTYADPEIIWNPIEEPPTQGHDAVRANLARWEGESSPIHTGGRPAAYPRDWAPVAQVDRAAAF